MSLFLSTALAAPAGSSLDTLPIGSFTYFADKNFPDLIANIITVLQITILPAALAVFIVGALLLVISAGNDERKSFGKDLMIGSLVGVAVVFGARAILSTVVYFVWG